MTVLPLDSELEKWLKDCRKLAILGIGNPLRGDDAVGLHILKRLEGKVPPNVKLFNCETTPENFLEEIERLKPSHVLFVDAAQFETEPGTTKLIGPEKIAGIAVSTHAIPLHIIAAVLQRSIDAKIALLGVQPDAFELREGLSPELKRETKKIAKILIESLKKVCS